MKRTCHIDTAPDSLGGALQCFGTFPTAIAAARIYDLAVRHITGEDAVLNFPLTDYVDGSGKLKAQWAAKVPTAALAAATRRGGKRVGGKRGKKTAAEAAPASDEDEDEDAA